MSALVIVFVVAGLKYYSKTKNDSTNVTTFANQTTIPPAAAGGARADDDFVTKTVVAAEVVAGLLKPEPEPELESELDSASSELVVDLVVFDVLVGVVVVPLVVGELAPGGNSSQKVSSATTSTLIKLAFWLEIPQPRICRLETESSPV